MVLERRQDGLLKECAAPSEVGWPGWVLELCSILVGKREVESSFLCDQTVCLDVSASTHETGY